MQFWEVTFHVDETEADTVATVFQEWPEVQGLMFTGGNVGQPLHPEYGEWFAAELTAAISEEVAVGFYLPDWIGKELLEGRLRAAVQELQQLGVHKDHLQWTLTVVDEDEWSKAWEDEIQPFPVGQRFIVMPTNEERWEAAKERDGAEKGNSAHGRQSIYLLPGRAFGTGLHPTTQLCIELLEEVVTPGSSVLDVGSGTGILAIAAAKLGAARAVAVDIDPVAVHVAAENCENNHVRERVQVVEGDLVTSLHADHFDLVLANILRGPVIELTALIPQFSKKGTSFIVSGFLEGDLNVVTAALMQAGFTVRQSVAKSEWAAIWAVFEG